MNDSPSSALSPRASAPTSDLRPLMPSSHPALSPRSSVLGPPPSAPTIVLLTAGRDKPYALGLASALAQQGIQLDYLGSDEVDGPELRTPLINFLNVRDQRTNASAARKVLRIFAYYKNLIVYAATTKARILHILWNNKFELFDRTLLMLFYKLMGKRLVFTAHNVNAGKRDGNDSLLNRLSLRIQYSLADHIFVHTERMKAELLADFAVPAGKATVIPFGINNTLPVTSLTRAEARERLGIGPATKTLLFFGNIAPYKGLEFLVDALAAWSGREDDFRLIIAGKPKGFAQHWEDVRARILSKSLQGRVIERIEYIPDESVELYFKAADLLVIPYTHVFQSGVLFLGYSFGLPVIATDVGSLREEIVEGKTGFVCKPEDAQDLARTIEKYFASALYTDLERHREAIRSFANDRYSWSKVAEITRAIYTRLLALPR